MRNQILRKTDNMRNQILQDVLTENGLPIYTSSMSDTWSWYPFVGRLRISSEAIQDMQIIHDIDIKTEITQLILLEIQHILSNLKKEKK